MLDMRSGQDGGVPEPPDLGGQWVAVRGEIEVVDFDTELDELCNRVVAAGLSGLVIFRQPARQGTPSRCLAC